MSKYLEVARTHLKMQFAWRADVVFNTLLTITRFLFAYLLWGVIFSKNKEVEGFTFYSMISYYMISTFLTQMDRSRGISEEIRLRIRNGTFSKYMIIPINIEGYFIARMAGEIAFYIGFDLAATILWILLFKIQLVFTTDLFVILCAVILIILGLFFMAQLNYYLGLLTLKYQEISTFLRIKNHLISLVTGAIIPVALFPEMLVKALHFLPFYYITYLPSMLLINRSREEAVYGIPILIIWCFIMQVVINVTWKSYRKKYDGVGI